MICKGCGGVLGRDCFNEPEYIWIGEQQSQAAYERDLTARYKADLNAAYVLRLTPDAYTLPGIDGRTRWDRFAEDFRARTQRRIGYCTHRGPQELRRAVCLGCALTYQEIEESVNASE